VGSIQQMLASMQHARRGKLCRIARPAGVCRQDSRTAKVLILLAATSCSAKDHFGDSNGAAAGVGSSDTFRNPQPLEGAGTDTATESLEICARGGQRRRNSFSDTLSFCVA